MAALGVAFLVVIGLVLLLGLFIVGRSLPDINRYRRLRKM